MITWGAMVYTADEAAQQLEADDVSVEIVDLRTIMPWDKQAVLESARKTSKVLVLHEDTRTGGFGAEIAATIAEEAFEDLDAPREADHGARHAGAVLAAAREGVHPAGRGRRRRAERARRSTDGHHESAVDVVMPQMGVSVSEGTITKWLKQVGEHGRGRRERCSRSRPTRSTPRCRRPGTGVVQEILVQEGRDGRGRHEARRRSRPRARSAAPAAGARAAARARDRSRPHARAEARVAGARLPSRPAAEPPAPAHAPRTARPTARRFVSPVVARIASEHGVDPAQVPGHRPRRPRHEEGHPRVHRVRRAGSGAGRARSRRPARAAAAPGRARSPRRPHRRRAPTGGRQPGETLEPMTAMRRGIAEHMRRSLDTSAHVTSAIEVDMSKVVAIRKKLKKEFQEAYGVNPTYLAFVARAAVETLRDYPWINGEIRGDQIVTRNYVNLGFAVELADGKGLIVPVLKNAEGLNLLGIARGVADIAQRARDKKLLPDDVQGGTFTITNPGGYGTFHGTPVISQPQAAILGTYAVVKRPWVVQDELGQDVIAIRPIMNLTLTYDHRLVDGALAGRFLRDLREKLESWGEADY